MEKDKVGLAKNIIKKSRDLGVKLILPIDSVNALIAAMTQRQTTQTS